MKYIVCFLISFASIAQEGKDGSFITCDLGHIKNSADYRHLRFAADQQLTKTANFQINYVNVPENAKIAIEGAVDLWSRLISSKQLIRVKVSWENYGSRALANARASKVYKNYDRLPQTNVWYPGPLAEAITNRDLNGGEIDIEININSVQNWATDPAAAKKANEFDLYSVVLHEVAHALGFTSSLEVSAVNKWGQWGGEGETNPSPYVFDAFVINTKDESLIDETIFKNKSEDLRQALINNGVFFLLKSGLKSGSKVKLYAPATYASGSSISHFDESTYKTSGGPDAIMTPGFTQAEIYREVGSSVLHCMANMGWRINPEITDFALNFSEVVAFPNPILNDLTIGIPKEMVGKTLTYSLFNMNGIKLISETNSIAEIENLVYLSGIPHGQYILKIEFNNENKLIRIIK